MKKNIYQECKEIYNKPEILTLKVSSDIITNSPASGKDPNEGEWDSDQNASYGGN